jgi:hypothetical protein
MPCTTATLTVVPSSGFLGAFTAEGGISPQLVRFEVDDQRLAMLSDLAGEGQLATRVAKSPLCPSAICASAPGRRRASREGCAAAG